MSESWSLVPVLISAVSGAAAGGLASILVGASKAEREERGKRRIEVRSEVGRTLRAFRYEYKQARLQRLEKQLVSTEAVFKSALELAATTNSAVQILAMFERVNLRRRVASVVGVEMIGLANLQPDCTGEITNAALQMTAEKYRRDPRVSIQQLIEIDPLAPNWGSVLRRIERLARKYP